MVNASSEQQALSFFDVLRFAAGYWRRQPLKLSGILTLRLSAALLETYLPSALAAFLAAVQAQRDKHTITTHLVTFLAVYAAHLALTSVAYITYNTFETRLFKSVCDDVYIHVCQLPETYFASTFAGSIISKINRARQRIEPFEDVILLRVLPTLVVLAGSTIFLARRFPVLAVLMVAYLGVILAVSAILVFRISGPAQAAYATAQDDFTAHLADSVTGMSAIKSFAREESEIERFLSTSEELRIRNVRAYTLSNLAGLVQQMLMAGMLVLLLGGGTWYLFHGQANMEGVAYLALAYTIVQSYVQDIGDNVKQMLTASYDLHAVIALLREAPEVPATVTLPDIQFARGAIIFENVTFAYPGKSQPVFQNFNLAIQPGERVALVGHSGSGKSTFVRLLQGLYAVQAGRILIDGNDIAQVSRRSLRGAIALVPQDPILFHRTLRENIGYGCPASGMDAIRGSARQAHIDEFITGMSEQYETLVGERGIKLSGGERQRVAIARAILADRPILILDEATSSLDSASERAIQDGLLALTHGRTSIMIAHRLSTILDADRIVVFDHGVIAEQGTHAELVAKAGGIYAGFFELQSGGFIPAD